VLYLCRKKRQQLQQLRDGSRFLPGANELSLVRFVTRSIIR
jgi:hypothetical protein